MRRAAASEGATWWLVSAGSAGMVAMVVMASVGVVIPLEVAAMAEMDVVSVAAVETTSLQCERKHAHYLRFQPVVFGEFLELDGLERIDIVLPVGGAQDEATCT